MVTLVFSVSSVPFKGHSCENPLDSEGHAVSSWNVACRLLKLQKSSYLDLNYILTGLGPNYLALINFKGCHRCR